MKMRHFIYADAKEIDSMYSQIFGDITDINTTVSKENKAEIEAEIKIPNILQGFMPGNFSGDYERDWNSLISTQSHISIENKVMSLLEYASLSESDAIFKCCDKSLVIGCVDAIKYDQFLLKVNELLELEEPSNFDDFYEKYCDDINFSNLWKELAQKIISIKDREIPFDFTMRISTRSQEIEKLIVLNSDYPIIISFSYNKLLLSASMMAVKKRFLCAENFNVLGLMRQVGKGVYTIKPIAMWEIFDSKKVSNGFIAQVKKFKELFG